MRRVTVWWGAFALVLAVALSSCGAPGQAVDDKGGAPAPTAATAPTAPTASTAATASTAPPSTNP